MLNLQQLYGNDADALNAALNFISRQIRVAMPAEIVRYNNARNTLTVKPLIKEKVIDKDGQLVDMELPLLLDVIPVQLCSGGFYVNLPMKAGDECLVIFADNCIDGWWQNGGINNQAEMRRHDLSDGFAIVGVRSLPNKDKVPVTYDRLIIGSDTQKIEISGNDINLIGNVKVNGTPI